MATIVNYGTAGAAYNITTIPADVAQGDADNPITDNGSGKSCLFAATGNRLSHQLKSATNLTAFTNKTKMTLFGWIKPSQALDDFFWITFLTGGVTYLYREPGETLAFQWLNQYNSGSPPKLDTGVWRYAALAIDTTQAAAANRAALYISDNANVMTNVTPGTANISLNSSITFDATNFFTISGDTFNDTNFIAGRSASCGVWFGTTLSAADIQTLYNKAKNLVAASGYYAAVESGAGLAAAIGADLHYRMAESGAVDHPAAITTVITPASSVAAAVARSRAVATAITPASSVAATVARTRAIATSITPASSFAASVSRGRAVATSITPTSSVAALVNHPAVIGADSASFGGLGLPFGRHR